MSSAFCDTSRAQSTSVCDLKPQNPKTSNCSAIRMRTGQVATTPGNRHLGNYSRSVIVLFRGGHGNNRSLRYRPLRQNTLRCARRLRRQCGCGDCCAISVLRKMHQQRYARTTRGRFVCHRIRKTILGLSTST